MPRDPNGVYSLPAGPIPTTGELAQASQVTTPLNDIAAEITASLPRSGVAAMTANLQMGGFKVTNAANGTAASDLATKGQLDAAIAAIPDYSDGANLDNGSVANSKLADMAQGTLKGRAAGAGTGSPVDLTDAQLRTIIGNFGSATAGLAPASGGGTVNFLRADGTWTAPGDITLETQQDTTSGTQFDFTGLPAGINEIVVHFDGVSVTGPDRLLVQLGTSSGVETASYVSTCIAVNTAGLGTNAANSAAGFAIPTHSGNVWAFNGQMFIRRMSGNTWNASLGGAGTTISGPADFSAYYGGGIKTLAGTLDRVRLTRTGTDTFDAGAVNISYSR
ncbi:MAG: hypothetical protein ACK5X3_09155 [Pseudomonadota bacterium]